MRQYGYSPLVGTHYILAGMQCPQCTWNVNNLHWAQQVATKMSWSTSCGELRRRAQAWKAEVHKGTWSQPSFALHILSSQFQLQEIAPVEAPLCGVVTQKHRNGAFFIPCIAGFNLQCSCTQAAAGERSMTALEPEELLQTVPEGSASSALLISSCVG